MLDLQQLSALWQTSLQALQPSQQQYLTVHLYKHDTDGRGLYSFSGLCRALRAVRLITTSSTYPPGFLMPDGTARSNAISHAPLDLVTAQQAAADEAAPSAAGEATEQQRNDPPDTLPPPPPSLKYRKPTLAERLAEAYGTSAPPTPSKLYHHFVHKGRRLIMDRATGLVFSAVMRGPLPKLMGKVQRDSSIKPKRNLLTRAPFSGLSRLLQTHRDQLEDGFLEHDANEDGQLTVPELVLMLEYLSPSSNKADLLYFQVGCCCQA